MILSRVNLGTVKTIQSSNLLGKMGNKQYEDILTKIRIFHNLKCKTQLHEKLNTSKGVIKNRELFQATSEENKINLEKSELMNYKRINIRMVSEEQQTYTYILASNKLKIPKEAKLWYCLKKVEQYIPAPLKCFKCQKYGYHK